MDSKQSPKYCSGQRWNSQCEIRENCLRFTFGRAHSGSIDVESCFRSQHGFRIEPDTPEATIFRKMVSAQAREAAPFTLNRERMKIPTDDSMYDCTFCLEKGIEHKIEAKPNPNAQKGFLSFEYTWICVCTGCGRSDGPWRRAYD